MCVLGKLSVNRRIHAQRRSETRGTTHTHTLNEMNQNAALINAQAARSCRTRATRRAVRRPFAWRPGQVARGGDVNKWEGSGVGGEIKHFEQYNLHKCVTSEQYCGMGGRCGVGSSI